MSIYSGGGPGPPAVPRGYPGGGPGIPGGSPQGIPGGPMGGRWGASRTHGPGGPRPGPVRPIFPCNWSKSYIKCYNLLWKYIKNYNTYNKGTKKYKYVQKKYCTPPLGTVGSGIGRAAGRGGGYNFCFYICLFV